MLAADDKTLSWLPFVPGPSNLVSPLLSHGRILREAKKTDTILVGVAASSNTIVDLKPTVDIG